MFSEHCEHCSLMFMCACAYIGVCMRMCLRACVRACFFCTCMCAWDLFNSEQCAFYNVQVCDKRADCFVGLELDPFGE